ncbi:hypothetical protein F5884DRAFT_260263 [Xylogone sp. PMI_703]|nr:hypothetical protein F5884DRAFT_260263 [Xylogone sp. PMI_703]
MELETQEDRRMRLLKILPSKNDILTFMHFYRDLIAPFTTIFVDFECFESDVCEYLIALSTGEFRDTEKWNAHWGSESSVGLIGLILAVLAAGSYFSDRDPMQRTQLSHDSVRRSFQALRLANFLFKPSFNTIKALLVLGSNLQNQSQSNAAWAMLGTTIRLSQTIGLDCEKGGAYEYMSESHRLEARSLWSSVVQQEFFLSFCHGRTPTISSYIVMSSGLTSPILNIPYQTAMQYLCSLGVSLTTSEKRSDYNQCLQTLSAIDELYERVAPHLVPRENCKSRHQNLEHLTWKMHSSFFISYVCRPVIRANKGLIDAPTETILCLRARKSLIDVSQAFLDFQIISMVPLRT